MKTLIMNVYGMTCENCVDHVQRSLSLLPGVIDVQVDMMSRQARVKHDENLCTPSDLVMGVQRVGFQVDGFESVEVEPEPV
ncbi:MAG: heavy-metal-associated domain-containing protein [Planctomycetes bacterium]|nr:heavy-metal-associated domain-containing protein [Planctomycetota bacterium]